MKFIDKVKNYYREHGAAGVVWRSVEKLTGIRPGAISYEKWIRQNSRQETELERQRTEEFAYMPLFSIVVPLYRTKEQYLRELIASVQEQTYTNWELCLSDGSGADTPLKEILEEYSRADARIHVVHADAPLGISENTNAAIQEASGDYLAFADHDDLLAPEALYACVRRLNEEKICDVLYSDEDKISVDGKKRFDPQFKPDFNLDLLRSMNYICHLFVVKKSLAKRAGYLDAAYDGAQDYDFMFRCVEQAETSAICLRFCITGAAIRIPRRRIRRASFMLLKRGGVRYRRIWNAWASAGKCVRQNILDCIGQLILQKELLWYLF